METKRIIYGLVFLLAVSLLIVPQGWTQMKSMAKAPMIVQSFAAEKGSPGTAWKIYIEAQAGDADMAKIAATVHEPGVGYPMDTVYLKPQYQKHLKGYLQLNLSSDTGSLPEGLPITLNISVVDKNGKVSRAKVFPLVVEQGATSGQPPAPFNQGRVPRLGYIDIDLSPEASGVHE